MSGGRTKQPATSRRTRRAEQPVAVVAEAQTQRRVVVSNPIFYCGAGDQQDGGANEWKSPAGDHLLRRVVYDGEWKAPLPLPPCRAHRVGPACAVVGPQGARVVSRRGHRHQKQDPFLAAYVACSKSSSSSSGSARAKRQHGEKTTGRRRRGEKGDVVVRGRGVWMNGWAAGAKCAAAMSCKNGYYCAVNNNARARGAPSVSMAKKEEEEAPTLDLSWAPVVLSARARERRREQR